MIPSRPRRLAMVMAMAGPSALFGPAVLAQYPQARLSSVSRTWVCAGETAEVTLRGSDLEGANGLWFDHPGLSAVHVKELTFRISATPDVPLGHHDVRAVGTYGVSNPRTIVVGDRPESIEVEPNNTPEQAGAIVVNSVMQGRSTAAPTSTVFRWRARRDSGCFWTSRPNGSTAGWTRRFAF